MGIQHRISGTLGVITIENDGKFNAMNARMFQELEEALVAYEQNPKVSAIVITGKGQNFCAGFDVNEIYQLSVGFSKEQADTAIRNLRNIVEHLARYPKQTIAGIDGVCLGGGLELALACSFRLASRKARFGFP